MIMTLIFLSPNNDKRITGFYGERKKISRMIPEVNFINRKQREIEFIEFNLSLLNYFISNNKARDNLKEDKSYDYNLAF